MTKKPELLAPAGDMECLQTALRFGADAVYVGGPLLQLRAASAGFDRQQLTEAVNVCRQAGKKLYVTVNSVVKDDELAPLAEYARFLADIGVHGVIVSDLGALSLIRRTAPDLPIHVSTQANCQNAQAALTYADLGASRIVLAREMTLEDIKTMRRHLPDELELEAFVHGAMCMAYSGRCFISSMLTGRSGNRGECTQPCRWGYHLMEQKRPGEFFAVEETERGTNILSSRDLNCLDFLDQLTDAGIASFKIEGRMKTPYYVATVVNAYRRRIDGTAPLDVLRRELNAVSHRPYCDGFYFGGLERYKPDPELPYIRECVFVGTVVETRPGRILVEQRGKFSVGDRLEVVSPHAVGLAFCAEHITDCDGQPMESAPHAMQRVWVDCPHALQVGDLIRSRVYEEE